MAFKSTSLTKIDFAIRLSSAGIVQCLSINGQDCVPGLKTQEDCRDFITKNRNLIKPLSCSNQVSGDWCNKGHKYFYETYQCPSQTGLPIAIKMDSESFNVECLSKDGKSCFRGKNLEKACDKANTCKKFRKRWSQLRCGGSHKKIWGHNGYFFSYDHWCKKAFAFYRYTGRILFKDTTGIETPVRINEVGNIQCFSQDGRSCVWGIQNRQQGRDMMNGKIPERYLTCGRRHLKLYRTTGFKQVNHWCRVAFRALFKRRKENALPESVKVLGVNRGYKWRIKGGRNGLPPKGLWGGRISPNKRGGKGRIIGKYTIAPLPARVRKAQKKHKKRINRYLIKIYDGFMRKPIVKRIRREIRGRKFLKNPESLRAFINKLKNHVDGGKHFWTEFIHRVSKRKPLNNIVKLIVRQNYLPVKYTGRRVGRRGRLIKIVNRIIGAKLLGKLKFRNGKSSHDAEKKITLTSLSTKRLPSSFSVNIKLDQVGIFTLGLSNRRPRNRPSWIGIKRGEFGFFGKYAVMGERRLSFLVQPLKSGDVVTLWAHNGRVGYRVNGMPNGYSFRLKGKNYWLVSSLLLPGDRVSIVGSQGYLERNKKIRDITSRLVKTPMARKVNKIIKSGKLGQPKSIHRIRRIFKRNKISGRIRFWDMLFRLISMRKPIRKIMKVIAYKKWERRYRPNNGKSYRIMYAERLISRNPWMGNFCRWSRLRNIGYRRLRRFARRWRLYGSRFLRGLYRMIRGGARCYKVIKSIQGRRKYIRNQRVSQIFKTNLLSDIVWQNGSRVYTQPRWAHLQMVSRQMLPLKFAVNVRINNLHRYHITMGVKSNPFPRNYWWSYLGWYPGEWAIMDHTAIFAERTCRFHNVWKGWGNGAVITIWGNNGLVGMRLNGQPNGYVYNMRTSNLWLGVTLYANGDQVEIVGGEGNNK
jgi:hypothetical protein